MNAMRAHPLPQGSFPLKALLLTAGVILLTPSESACADIWCRRDFGSDNPICVFGNARDCVRAAAIAGGVCEREPPGRAAASQDRKPAPRIR